MDSPEKSLADYGNEKFASKETLSAIKIPLLSTRLSSRMSIVLAVIPILFLLGVLFNHFLGISFWPLTGFYEWVGDHDRTFGDASFINWLIRFALIGGPMVIIFINLLSVLHVQYSTRELVITILLKWKSILLILLGLLIFSVFFGYLLAENFG